MLAVTSPRTPARERIALDPADAAWLAAVPAAAIVIAAIVLLGPALGTQEQLEESLAALRAAHGTKVFVMTGGYAYRGLAEALATTHRAVAEDGFGMSFWLAR